MRRAADVESYGNAEFALGGEEEGWTATHADPEQQRAASAAQDIPSIDDVKEEEPGGEADIPDIDDLAIAEEEDEATAGPSASGGAALGGGTGGYLRASEPEDNILRTRTYDLHVTYDQFYHVSPPVAAATAAPSTMRPASRGAYQCRG